MKLFEMTETGNYRNCKLAIRGLMNKFTIPIVKGNMEEPSCTNIEVSEQEHARPFVICSCPYVTASFVLEIRF